MALLGAGVQGATIAGHPRHQQSPMPTEDSLLEIAVADSGIGVQSELSHGSVFGQRARMTLATGPMASAEGRDRRVVAPIQRGLTVMAAEVNRTNLMVLRKMLRGAVVELTDVANDEQVINRIMPSRRM
jgi:hypothetical protein